MMIPPSPVRARCLLLSVLLLLVTTAGTAEAQAPAAAAAPGAYAPPSDTAAPLIVVQKLFDAMRARDTAAMRAAFVENPALSSWTIRNDQPQLARDSLAAFLTSVARAPAELLLDERLYHPKVHISDGVASVWVEYDLYVNERFSHCGVDAIHLVHTTSGWKIMHLIDTRRRAGCPGR